MNNTPRQITIVEQQKLLESAMGVDTVCDIMESNFDALEYLFEEMADITDIQALEAELQKLGVGEGTSLVTGIRHHQKRDGIHWWLLVRLINDVKDEIGKIHELNHEIRDTLFKADQEGGNGDGVA